MEQLRTIVGIVLKKNRRRLVKGAGIFLILLITTLAMVVLKLPGTVACKYCLVFFPFLFCWYFLTTFEYDFFYVNILPRKVCRQHFFWAVLIVAAFPAVWLLVAAPVLSLQAGASGFLGHSACMAGLLLVDFLLLLVLSFAFSLVNVPVLSLIIVFLPALIVFKSSDMVSIFQVNYSFPLLLASEDDFAEFYQFIGGLCHIAENLVVALVILYVCHYFYLRKDLVT